MLLRSMASEHHGMAEALSETGAGDDRAGDQCVRRGRGDRPHERRPHPGGRGAAPPTHEESELEPQLHPHTGRPEWKAVEKKLSRQPPSVAGPFFAWLTDGMSDEADRVSVRTIDPGAGRHRAREGCSDAATTATSPRSGETRSRRLGPSSRACRAVLSLRRTLGRRRRPVGRRHETAGRRAVGAQRREPDGAALLDESWNGGDERGGVKAVAAV